MSRRLRLSQRYASLDKDVAIEVLKAYINSPEHFTDKEISDVLRKTIKPDSIPSLGPWASQIIQDRLDWVKHRPLDIVPELLKMLEPVDKRISETNAARSSPRTSFAASTNDGHVDATIGSSSRSTSANTASSSTPAPLDENSTTPTIGEEFHPLSNIPSTPARAPSRRDSDTWANHASGSSLPSIPLEGTSNDLPDTPPSSSHVAQNNASATPLAERIVPSNPRTPSRPKFATSFSGIATSLPDVPSSTNSSNNVRFTQASAPDAKSEDRSTGTFGIPFTMKFSNLFSFGRKSLHRMVRGADGQYSFNEFYPFTWEQSCFMCFVWFCHSPQTVAAFFYVVLACSVYAYIPYSKVVLSGRVVASEIPNSGVHLELGGLEHQADWYDRAQKVRKQIRKTIWYNRQNVHLGLKVHFGKDYQLANFGRHIDALIPKLSCPPSRMPNLHVKVTVPKTKEKLGVDKIGVDLDRAGNLDSLTWQGQFFAEVVFSCKTNRFERLRHLRLIDCPVDDQVLFHIMSACPCLVTLEIQHFTGLSKTPQVVSSEPRPKPRITPYRLLRAIFYGFVAMFTVSASLIFMALHNKLWMMLYGKPPFRTIRTPESKSTSSNSTPRPRGRILLNDLKTLTIHSVADVRPIFAKAKMPKLETLNLRLAPSACRNRIEDDLATSRVDWTQLREVEIRAPFRYADADAMRKFFSEQKRNPIKTRRERCLVDREVWYPVTENA